MRLDIHGQSDVGRRKRNNEDSFGVFGEASPDLALFEEGALLCVADGLGGHIGGEIASKLAVSVLGDVIREKRPPESDDAEDPDGGLRGLFLKYFGFANDNIYQTNLDLVKSGKPMGTTLLGAFVEPGKVHVINVGDSRCYQIRDGEIVAQTEDHSWVDEQVKLGLMSKETAENDRRRNLVTRSLGTHPDVAPDTYVWRTVPGDALLLCTDGLVNMVSEADICTHFKADGTAEEIAQRLVDRANANGGRDNITVVVARLSPPATKLAAQRTEAWLRRHGKVIGAALLGAALFAAGFVVHALLQG